MRDWRAYTTSKRVAYFTMEIGLTQLLPTYSGGLGILAGDTIKSAADLGLPMVCVTLAHRKGYFQQKIENGAQTELPVTWQPDEYCELLPYKTVVSIEDRDVKVQGWLYRQKSPVGNVLPVIFLDTDIAGNADEDRKLTDHLYGGDSRYRLKQEIVLGIGGVRILAALGFRITKYHMNEGHASLLTLELLRNNARHADHSRDGEVYWDHGAVRDICVFTTHTPVPAGHDVFDYDLVKSVLSSYVPLNVLQSIGGSENLNMTRLGMNLSGYINGVAKKHGEVSREMFPGYKITSITNGVHPQTWTSPFMAQIFSEHLPGWAIEPELLVRADRIPNEDIWSAHQSAKEYLFSYIEETTGVLLDKDILTLGFARRAAPYKRGDLIFTNIEHLLKIGSGKLQFVFGGKAHPADQGGKEIIQNIIREIEKITPSIKAVYLENYNMEVASRLIPGVDVWLNNPIRPMEASGTSGMKAALNGVPNFSVLDGWWIEGHIEGVTGWSIGPDETSAGSEEDDIIDMYRKLEDEIIPMYYGDRQKWAQVMKGAISKNGFYFTTHNMMRRYVSEAYLR